MEADRAALSTMRVACAGMLPWSSRTSPPPPPPPPPPPKGGTRVGGLSLSVIVSVAEVTPSDRSGAVPLTVTVSFGSSLASSTGVRVNVAVPV